MILKRATDLGLDSSSPTYQLSYLGTFLTLSLRSALLVGEMLPLVSFLWWLARKMSS